MTAGGFAPSGVAQRATRRDVSRRGVQTGQPPLPSSAAPIQRRSGRWQELVQRAPEHADPFSETLGHPGLWRYLRGKRALERVFDLPPLASAGDGNGNGAGAATAASESLLAWAEATSSGKLVDGAGRVSSEEVASWFSPHRLTVRAGSLVTQGSLECSEERLALVFGELAQVPDTLPPM